MPSDLPDDGIPIGKEADDSVIEASELCFSTQNTSSIDKYNAEWARLRSESHEELVQRALAGELRAARLRSVAWRRLLGLLKQDWIYETRDLRQRYCDLKTSLSVDPRRPHTPPSLDNPLSQHNQSTWHQYFCDGELRSVILQDVRRTFPSLDFFRSEDIQSVMVDILFCYARENPLMCYRQGMHEILAPVLFVLSCDHQALLHLQQQTTVSAEIIELVNPDFLEEDGYMLFKRIMDSVEGCYHISDVVPLATGHFPSKPNPCSAGENQVIAQLRWIKEKIFSPTDPQLCQHLENLDISLPLFAIRWLRLIFGREFALEDLLVLWDSIFAFDATFDLVNYIVVAMLHAIRTTLLTSDYTSCLSLLMRYPSTMDISYIVDYALHLKHPQKYAVPKCSGYTQVKMSPRISEEKPFRSLPRPTNSRQLPANMPPAPIEGREIVEGYSLSDPVVLKGELENYRRLMTLCQIKIDQYLAVIEPIVPIENDSAQQALAGLHQLTQLLEAASSKDPDPSSSAVELAAEAGPDSPASVESNTSRGAPQQAVIRSKTNQKRPTSVDMTVFKQLTLSSPTADLPRDYPALSPLESR